MKKEPSAENSPLHVLEESGLAFDPMAQHLDLTKEEKRRTTALFMAINAYHELIIREADYLREASTLAQRGDGPQLQPATIDAMVLAAMKFDAFLAGSIRVDTSEKADEPKQER